MTPWWRRGAIYQIYPRSFADADADGVGDLRGIALRLDHLSALGVEAIWLSPIFPSPMADFGYDVSDYCNVDPLFGTLADFDRLVAECHARAIKIVLDWVPNHTSDRHPWFEASRSNREDPKRDWYVWSDGAPAGGPPNDWRSAFEAVGAAWTYDEQTGQWYLHSFMAEQPDLNWDNPEVEAAMHDVLRFWLDRGVDGFRLDAIDKIAKDPELRDNADGPLRRQDSWRTIHQRLRGVRRVVDEHPERIIVGEVHAADLHELVAYLNTGDQLHMVHNFHFAVLPWNAEAFRTSIDDFEALTADDAWPAWFIANHDLPRVASRFGAPEARAIGVILYALRGTPFVYQGEELGLPDAEIPPDRVVDVDGRDPQRAPIPWQLPSKAGPGAGFTTGEPWLPLVAGAEELCVERQAADPRSALSLFRALAALRAATPALQTGSQCTLDAGPDVLAWVRGADDERVLGAANFGAGTAPLAVEGPATLLLSSDPDRLQGDAAGLALRPGEAVLLRLGPPASTVPGGTS